MNEQKKLNSMSCFMHLAGIFLVSYLIFFISLKAVFTYAVQIDINNTPLQIFTNCSILIFSSIISWTISYLFFRKQDYEEESIHDLIKYLIVFISIFAIIHLAVYIVITIKDVSAAKAKLEALKRSNRMDVTQEYADFTNTITTISSYKNRKLTYASLSFLSLLVSNLGAFLLIIRFSYTKFHPELKYNIKEKIKNKLKDFKTKHATKKLKASKPNTYKIQNVEQSNQQSDPKQTNQTNQNTQPENVKPKYSIQEVEMNNVKKE